MLWDISWKFGNWLKIDFLKRKIINLRQNLKSTQRDSPENVQIWTIKIPKLGHLLKESKQNFQQMSQLWNFYLVQLQLSSSKSGCFPDDFFA